MRLPTLPWFVDCIREEPTARKMNARIVFGREQMTRTVVTESVVLVDVARGEGVDAYARPSANAGRQRASDGNRYEQMWHRAIAGEALILAVSTVKGARREDHVELCDRIVNDFIVAMTEAARRHRVIFEPGSGGSPIPEDETSALLASGYGEHGARYVLRFFITAPIVSQPIPTATIGPPPATTIESVIKVPYGGSTAETEV